jgi:hypothetical protein
MVDSVRSKLEQLVTDFPLADLGPGRRVGALSERELRQRLAPLLPHPDLGGRRRELIRALLLLWHDHLEAAHEIVQGIPTPEGSCVHAIMHRREPDYANSKYWWRKTGPHPALPELARRVETFLRAAGAEQLAGRLMPAGGWDAIAFVDCVAAAGGDRRQAGLWQQVQQLETLVLLEDLLGPGR